MSDETSRRRDPIIEEAFRILGKGARRKIGDACGITSQAVSDWDRVPPDRVLIVESLTGIPRERIRPDIFGAPRPRPRRRVSVEAAA